jgi:hypothetical protein
LHSLHLLAFLLVGALSGERSGSSSGWLWLEPQAEFAGF